MSSSSHNRIVQIGFGLTSLLGLMVVFGWWSSVPLSPRIHESLAPMQFNNALCFVLLGIVGFLSFRGKTTVSSIVSVIGLIISLTTFAEYVFDFNLGIDQLIFRSSRAAEMANPGRMAPNSALTHVFAFAGFILLNIATVLPVRVAGIISAMVFSSGFVSLIGYMLGFEKLFSWGHYSQMAFLTSVGFVISGGAMMMTTVPKLRAWVVDKTIEKFYFWPYLTVFLIAVFMIDRQLPQDVAVGLIYAIVVMSAWFAHSKRSMLIMAGICTVLIILDTVLTTEVTQTPWGYTRGVAILSVWTAAFVLHYLRIKSEKLAEVEIRFKSIFNNAYQFIGLLKPDGTLIEANQTALDFAGVTIAEIRGMKFWDTPWWSISDEVKNQMREAIEAAASGEFVRYDVDNQGADGTVLTVDFSLRPIKDENGNVIYLVPEGRDISDRKELEVKLKTNQKLLQQFVKHTPNAVAMFNTNLEYIVASDAWFRDYGIQGKEIIGVHHYDVFPEIREMPEWQSVHKRALNGELIKKERDPFVREDGSTNWLRYAIQPWMNERDEIGGIIMFTEVITERVQLEQNLENSEKRFHLAVQGTTAGIWDWLDIEGDKQWWSPRFLQLLGYEPGEIEPSLETFSSLLHPDDNEMTFKMVDRHFKRKTPFLVEYRLKTKSGKFRWFLGSGQATWDDAGNPDRMVGTIIDIHSRKMAEEAEIQHARDLADKNKELEEFTYVASHDLQEPVRTISSFVELFRETYSDQLDEEGLKWLDFMQGASERSQRLIIDLLEYSRIGKARELKKINLNQLIKDVTTDLQARIQSTNATVESEELPEIMGFETELRLLFQNLVGNGIKFKKPDENPFIKVSYSKVDGFHQLTVSDNGIGIEEKYFDKVFVIFRRLHGKSEYEGTGIGLAHCKKVVDLHQGKIWVTSTFGQGTSFHFTIPENLAKPEQHS